MSAKDFSPRLESVSWCEHLGWVSKHYRIAFGDLVMEFKGRFQIILRKMLRSKNTCTGRPQIQGQRTHTMAVFSSHTVVSNGLGILRWELLLELSPL